MAGLDLLKALLLVNQLASSSVLHPHNRPAVMELRDILRAAVEASEAHA